MTIVQTLKDLHDAVMPDVVAAHAGLVSSVSTREGHRHGSPPRVIWVPTRDSFDGPQKNPRGGQGAQHSVATRVAGVQLRCWVEGEPEATELLIETIVRSILRHAGPGVSIVSGEWKSETGETELGEYYALNLTVPIDVRAKPTAGTTATVTSVTASGEGAVSGDGVMQAGETG